MRELKYRGKLSLCNPVKMKRNQLITVFSKTTKDHPGELAYNRSKTRHCQSTARAAPQWGAVSSLRETQSLDTPTEQLWGTKGHPRAHWLPEMFTVVKQVCNLIYLTLPFTLIVSNLKDTFIFFLGTDVLSLRKSAAGHDLNSYCSAETALD